MIYILLSKYARQFSLSMSFIKQRSVSPNVELREASSESPGVQIFRSNLTTIKSESFGLEPYNVYSWTTHSLDYFLILAFYDQIILMVYSSHSTQCLNANKWSYLEKTIQGVRRNFTNVNRLEGEISLVNSNCEAHWNSLLYFSIFFQVLLVLYDP